jgi:flagellar basal-body rod protein FlgF
MKSKLFLILCLMILFADDNTSVQALNSYERRYDTLMNNVVNANTPGFKASKVMTLQEDGKLVTEVIPTIGKTGPLIYSGDAFHVGIDGPGFFVVKGPKEDYYTRDGRFHLTADYQLVTLAGNYPVYGQGGPIQLQPGQNGTLSLAITNTGELVLNGAPLDRFLIVGINDISQLAPVNGVFFRKNNTNQAPSYQNPTYIGTAGESNANQDFLPLENVSVRQYYYEGSNVDISEEMISVPEISKKYDANSKVLQILKKMKTTGREMGSPQ